MALTVSELGKKYRPGWIYINRRDAAIGRNQESGKLELIVKLRDEEAEVIELESERADPEKEA